MSDGTQGSTNDQFASIPSEEELTALQRAPTDPAPANEQQEVTPAERPDWLPEKFESAEAFVASYESLETRLGSQADEIGTLRGVTDRLLAGGQPNPTIDPNPEISPDLEFEDVVTDPRGTIESVASAHIAPTNDRMDQIEAQLNLQAFEGRHPTYQADMQDPQFQTWASGSQYRTNLAAQAAQGDIGAAEELWTGWDEQKAAPATDPTPDPETEAALESATAVASRGGAETGVSASKPISREELAQIKMNDEDRYYSASFQKYVQDMYARGLVK